MEKEPTRQGQCRDCGIIFIATNKRGYVPHRCDDCRRRKAVKDELARRARNPEPHRAANRRYIERNREAIKERKRAAYDPVKKRAKTLRNLYGITVDTFDSLVEAQGGRCPICNTDEPGGRHGRWHVDHDHVSKKVRGLLCDACNRGIGFLRDDPDVIEAAAQYVRKHR